MNRLVVLRHALVVAVLLAVVQFGRTAGEASEAAAGPRKLAALPAIPFLEFASLGYREAMADIAWLQAVQYYGEHRQGGNDLSEFRHYVDAVNALDPRYEHAYVFGAFVLASEREDLQGALELLHRGARANPESSLFPFEMGFLTYVSGGDPEDAVRWLRIAAGLPGGRERAQRFMAFINRRLGRLETAWLLWEDIQRSSKDPGMRAVAAANMRRIESQLRKRGRP
jgi:hypothetical protein